MVMWGLVDWVFLCGGHGRVLVWRSRTVSCVKVTDGVIRSWWEGKGGLGGVGLGLAVYICEKWREPHAIEEVKEQFGPVHV